MVTVTAEEVRLAVQNAGIEEAQLRECSLCQYPLKYVFDGDRVLFDSGCHCTGKSENYTLCDWQDVADLINMQRVAEVQDRFRKLFGLLA